MGTHLWSLKSNLQIQKWLKRRSANILSTKSETRSSPETRWTDLFVSETLHGGAPRVSIVPSDDDSVVRHATHPSVTVPTRTPATAAETTLASKSSSSTTSMNSTA